MKTFREHSLRYALSNEFHARPFALLAPPERASHFAMLSDVSDEAAVREHLLALCERYDVAHPAEGAKHFSADFGPFRLKWERHTEFTTYTFFRQGAFDDPFAKPVAGLVPAQWLGELPGELLVATHVAVAARDAPAPSADELGRWFVAESLCGSRPTGGAAVFWTDFQIHEDGFGRILVHDLSMGPRQAGRLVQRLLEIETYRSMAMLALPLAREVDPKVTAIEQGLAELLARLRDVETVEDERQLLDRLTRLSAEIEEISAKTAFRFSAASAYYALVEARVAKLREQRAEALQPISEFIERRLAPAMRTCDSIAARQEVLAERAARAANLLRTRVDIALEGQNRDLLKSMDRRARVQLRLQQTVEGLSVVAISYYVVSLVGYVAEAANEAGAALDVGLVRGLSIPVVALVAWLVVRRIRRKVMAARKGSEDGR